MSGTITPQTELLTVSTLSGAVFTPYTIATGNGITSGTTYFSGETVSGVFDSQYNSSGTLISETGTIVLTSTLVNTGSLGFGFGASSTVTHETFAINGTTIIDSAAGNNNEFGSGIESKGTASPNYEIFLSSVSSSGTDPIFTDLHLDWNSETNPELYLGKQFNAGENATFYSALEQANGTNIQLSSIGSITTTDSIVGGNFTFTGATNSNFDLGSNYVGGIAPGYTLVPNEVVSIISGTAVITSPTLSDNGTIIVTGTGSTLVSTPSVGGTGMIDISSGGHVTLGGTGDVLNEISFGTGGTSLNPNLLDLSNASTESQLRTIANFGAFDTIIVNGFTPVAGGSLIDYYDPTNHTLSVSETSPQNPNGGFEDFFATITGPGPGTLNLSNFIITDGPNGLVISDQPCFAAGTSILTPDGEKLVEQLAVGDEVLTARENHEGVAKIIWVGHRTIDLARHAMPEKVRPIRILAGAFGPGLPERDLRLSPDHALYIDGHLIEAKTLVNGVTVIVEQNTRFVTYHHIETAQHDVVLAEGLPAETFLESGNRANFESDAAPIALHPDFVAKEREKACAKLLVDGPVVIAARQLLLDRAIALGFAPTGDVDLVVKAGVERIQPETDMDGELLLVLPAGLKTVALLSGTGVPAELSADPSDRRVLGVNIASLALIANGKRHLIALDDAAHEGFHDMEAGRRWTTGAARIALPAYSGRAVLEVSITGQAPRWVSNSRLSAA